MGKKELFNSLKNKGFSLEMINAFSKIKREDFIPEPYKKYAYEDNALPIGFGQTISQPYTIAFMLSLLKLKRGSKVLEIGSGSGYVLSLIHEITKSEIYGVEIKESLAKSSKKLLSQKKKIKIYNKSGENGLSEKGKFDRILISASCKDSRIVYRLCKQLKNKGILVAPVKNSILSIEKNKNKLHYKKYEGFIFVPFIETTNRIQI